MCLQLLLLGSRGPLEQLRAMDSLYCPSVSVGTLGAEHLPCCGESRPSELLFLH